MIKTKEEHNVRFEESVLFYTKKTLGLLESLLTGAFAGAAGKTLIAPGDRIKIIYQVDPTKHFSLTNAFMTGKKIVHQGGVLSLWTGNGATVMRVAPYAGITFFSFENYNYLMCKLLGVPFSYGNKSEEASKQKLNSKAFFARFIAGSLAGATATACTFPLDMLRARFAAHNDPLHPRYPSYYVAFVEITQGEGWRALYRGLLPTVTGIVPYAGCNFAVFETIKNCLIVWQKLESESALPIYQRLMAGAISGLTAQSLTYPLDIVRRRMQVTPHLYTEGVLKALIKIYQKEGLRQGLYKGLVMNWIKGPIATSTSFTMNDLLKGRINRYRKKDAVVHIPDEVTPEKQKRSLTARLVCGGIAGFLAKLWTAPFDRLKIMYTVGQVTVDEQGSRVNQMYNSIKEMYQCTPNMWQGSGVMMIRVIPYAALTYTSFESTFRFLGQRIIYSREETFLSNFLGGAMAASLSTVLLHPIEIIHVRTATSIAPRYLSYYIALVYMIRVKGFRSLFKGLSFSLLGIAPMAGLAFAIYEGVKSRYNLTNCYITKPTLKDDENSNHAEKFNLNISNNSDKFDFAHTEKKEISDLSQEEYIRLSMFFKLLLAGSFAGIISQTLTFPLNVLRIRAMIDDIVYNGLERDVSYAYTNKLFYTCLYGRMPLFWVLGAMTVGISFAINDMLLILSDDVHRQQSKFFSDESFWEKMALPYFLSASSSEAAVSSAISNTD